MYRKANHILLTALTALLAACVESGAPDDSYADVNVAVDLALAVSPTTNRTVTRMAGDVVEGNGALEDLLVIPFTVKGRKIDLTDMPRTFSVSGVSTDTYTNKDEGASRFYYYKNCSFMAGTTSVLAYAQAKRRNTTDGKVYNGSIASTGLETMTPANISFALESFVADNTAPAGAVTIVEALNELANVVRADRNADISSTNPTWSTTSNGSLQSLFKTFTWRDGSGTYTLLPGSSANMVCHLKEMKSRLAALSLTEGSTEAALRDALVAAIGSEATGSTAATGILATVADANYPRSLGLPDGAAALRWVDNVGGGAFKVETQTTTLASINNLSRYAYPPALMFYGNSEIYTSNEEVTESDYEGATTWSAVLDKYEYSNGTVSANTKAVAVIEPLQYAVGRLDFTLQKTTTTLKDGHGTDIDVGKTVEGNREETCFPLTGVVVGNQHTLGFDFVPPLPQTDLDTKFAYDSQVPTGTSRIYLNTTTESAPVSTLSLQTYDDEEVYIGLEFENQSGVSFQGIDGVVYPGTRFYLVGSINPTGVGTGDAAGRVFTKDYTTKVSLKVASLAKAYNVLPDLLSARLEVGVMVSHWVAATPGEVILD